MPITKLGIKRLYKLCEYMESLPKSANKHFDMRDYFIHAPGGDDHSHDLPQKPTTKDIHTCGTTACALGWAVTMPYMRRAGLYTDYNVVDGSHKVFGLPLYSSEGEEDRWEMLFGGNNKDKTPKAWARRVRKLLKQWEAEALAR